jgi:hypothetical protein
MLTREAPDNRTALDRGMIRGIVVRSKYQVKKYGQNNAD